MAFYTYILRSSRDGSYYIGSTAEPLKRLIYHNRGLNRSTRGSQPWVLVYCEEHPTRQEAIRRELGIKRMKSRRYIEQLLGGGLAAASGEQAGPQCRAARERG